jgi:hypothetical protein
LVASLPFFKADAMLVDYHVIFVLGRGASGFVKEARMRMDRRDDTRILAMMEFADLS